MNVHIRQAIAEDLELIKNFNIKLSNKEHADFDKTINPNFANTETGTRYFTNNINNESSLVLIAETEKKAVGYLVCSIEQVSNYRNISQMCEVDNMWVEEQYRNHKIGKQLLDKAAEWSKKKGIQRMRVVASAENIQAINFYTREGFSEYDLILEKDLF